MTRKIGVVGGGQLGRMLALAGIPLGFEFRFWDPSPDAPSRSVGELFQSDFTDINAVDDFARGLDVVTYEFENVPAEIIERLESRVNCRPGALALATSQDRQTEKTFFNNNGVETAPWRSVASLDELLNAVTEIGPGILKTRRFGYDGKGQARVNDAATCEAAWKELGSDSLIIEGLVSFKRELSLIGVRSASGVVSTWPLVENEHRGGILHKTIAPASSVSPDLQARADEIMKATMESLGHIGVLTIEFFETEDALIANEFAPRVHNSGHWTIEGAVTSQFENHIRAISGLPLGSCQPRWPSVMLNCIGSMPLRSDVMTRTGVHFHDYGKDSRPGRKVGHITLCDELPGTSLEEFARSVDAVEQIITTTTGSANNG